MTWTRRRKWTVGASAAAAALLGTAGAGRMMAAERILDALRAGLLERYGLEIRAGDVSLSLFRGTASFEDVRILDGPVAVLEAARIEVDGRVLDVIAGRYDCARLTVLRPVVRIFVEPDGRTNLQRILATPRKGAPGPGDVVVLREAAVEDGRVEYTDAILDPALPLRLVVLRLRGTITEWPIAGGPAASSATDLRADGEIEQPGFPARVTVAAWSSPPGGAPAWTLQAAVTGFDLRRIPQYVGASERAAIGGNLVHLAVDVRSRNGVIGPGAAVGEVAGSGTLLPMGIGGTTGDPVFEGESPLSSLLRIPLSRAGRFGVVALGAGWSVLTGGAGAVADVGGGVVDAGVSLGTGLVNAGGAAITGDPLGALAEAGGGILGVFTSLGGGLVDGAGSLLGGGTGAVDALLGADPADLDARFAGIHAARRLAILEAALASSGGAGEGARRARIEAEVAAPPY